MRGFTLIEVLIALTLLGITFSTLFYLLGKERGEFSYYRELYMDVSELTNRVETQDLRGLQVRERRLEEYGILEKIYIYGKAELRLYSR